MVGSEYLQEFYANVIDSVGDGVIVLDRDGRVTLKDGIPAPPQFDISSGVLDMPSTGTVAFVRPGDFHRGYIQTWNLTLEKELSKGFVASAAYVASHTINQLGVWDQNYAPIGGGTAGRILNKKFGRTADTGEARPIGTQRFDSLQARLDKRFSGGYQIMSNFTWGKSIGWAGVNNSDDEPRIKIPEYFFLNHGRTGIDQRLAFHLVGSAELPFGRTKPFAKGRGTLRT